MHVNRRRFYLTFIFLAVFACDIRALDLGARTITIRSKEYQAEISPDFGGNCLRLLHLPTGMDVLRSPKSIEDLEATPLLYGMPILFFPNRISGGKFVFEGRNYSLPINEPLRNNHIHGSLYMMPFRMISRSDCELEMEFVATAQQPYLTFSHAFTLRLYYKVDSKGLHQKVTVVNKSTLNMPFGLAFHTTFNTPFATGGKSSFLRLNLPVDREYLRDSVRLVTTGKYLADFPLRHALREGGATPEQHVLSNFFSRQKNKKMILKDTESGWAIQYRADRHHRYWMLWNGGRDDLLTVEPQTCMIDPFNVDLPTSEKRILVIKPNSSISLKTGIAVKKY